MLTRLGVLVLVLLCACEDGAQSPAQAAGAGGGLNDAGSRSDADTPDMPSTPSTCTEEHPAEPKLVGRQLSEDLPCDLCPPEADTPVPINPLLSDWWTTIWADDRFAVVSSLSGSAALVELGDGTRPTFAGLLHEMNEVVYAAISGDTLLAVARGADAPGHSRVLAYSIVDPERPQLLNTIVLDGNAFRATRRGDVLVVETRDEEATYLASFDVRDPAQPEPVSALEFPFALNANIHWAPFAAFGTDRVYVLSAAGESVDTASTHLQVVDASDPGGELQLLPTETLIDGLVYSPGQLAELGDTIATVTAPSGVSSPIPARVQLWARDDLAALDAVDASLAASEHTYASAIAAGRAFALEIASTGETRLRVFDLADLTAPSFVIDLGMAAPYTVQMVAVDDTRILVRHGVSGLEGPLLLTLYELTATSAAQVDELQLDGPLPDHGLRFFPELGVAAVPHASHTVDECGTRLEATLTVVAPSAQSLDLVSDIVTPGDALSGLAAGRVLVSSQGRVAMLDPQAPSDPAWTNVARGGGMLALDGERVVRVAMTSSGIPPQLDVVPLERGQAPSTTALELVPTDGARTCPWGVLDVARLGSIAAVTVFEEVRGGGNEASRQSVLSVDITDPSAPRILSTTPWPDGGGNALVLGATADALVRAVPIFEGDTNRMRVETLAISGATAPQLSSFELPAHEPTSSYRSLRSGTIVALPSIQRHPSNAPRYWLDRVDVADPLHPEALPRVEVPGEVIAFDAASSRALVRNERVITATADTEQTCRQALGPYAQLEPPTCNALAPDLRIVAIDTGHACVLAHAELPNGPLYASDQAFASLVGWMRFGPTLRTLVFGAWNDANLAPTEVEVPEEVGWIGDVRVVGTKVFVQGARTAIYDAACPDAEPLVLAPYEYVALASTEGGEPVAFVMEATSAGLVTAPSPCD